MSSRRSLHVQRWGEYLKLGLPACAMTCLEWWLYEVAMILSGLLPDPQMSLSVSGICSQIVSLAFMVPLGVSIALRIRVSNLLGALHTRMNVFAVVKAPGQPIFSNACTVL